MGIAERRIREKTELKDRIMETAREMFAEEGYDSVSMRRIAERIEYSPTAIYVYFKDKESLIREICREDFGKLAVVSAKLAKVADPVERIRQLGNTYVRFAVENPNHYRLMFMTSLPKGELDEDDLECKNDPDENSYAFLMQTVQEAFDQGRFRPEFKDPVLIVQTVWAMAHGIASLQIAKGNDPWIEWASLSKRIGAGIDSVLRGMTIEVKKNGSGK